MSKHTPGPWILADGFARADMSRHFVWSDAESREEREDGSTYCIATINPRTDTAQLEANARLIAAAPDMADLILSWSSWYRGGQNPAQLPALGEWTRDVIAKAGL